MSERRQLPLGWHWVSLRQVIDDAQSGFASGERDPNGTVQLRMNNVDTRGNLVWDDFIRVPATPDQVSKYQLQPGDVLFNNTNSTELVGKTALFKSLAEPVVFSNHFTRLRTKPDLLDSGYLASWILQQWQMGVFAKICNQWIGQSAVKPGVLLELEIPLPPLPEQRRIVAVLEERLAAVERARRAARAQLDAARALPAAYLRAVFDGEEARGWPLFNVRSLCRKIDYGHTASADFSIKFPKFLRITDIQNGAVDWSSVPGCQISEREEEANRLSDGDIVFARTGGTVGKSYLIESPPRSVFASYLIRMTPNENVLPQYLYLFFQSDGYWRQVLASARGGAQPNVNAQILGNLKLRVPQITKQKNIAKALKAQLENVDRLVETIQQQLVEIELLPAGYLQQAFSGELT